MISLWNGERSRLFAALVAAALAQVISAAAAAWCVQHLFNRLIGATSAVASDTYKWAAGFAIAAILGFLLEVLQRRLGEDLGLKYTAEVRLALFDHHMKVPAERLAAGGHGALLLPFVGDLSAIKQWVSDGLARISVAVITVTALIAIIGSKSPILAIVIAGTMSAGVAALMSLARPLDHAVRDLRRRRGGLASFVSGRLTGVATIQAMGRSNAERKKVFARTQALNRAAIGRAWVTGVMRGIAQLTGSLLILSTLLVGMIEIQSGRATPGAVVAAIGLVGLLAGSMRDAGRAMEIWYPARTSRERIAKALRQPVRRRAARSQSRPSPAAHLSIDGLSIAATLRDVSALAYPGDVILVEGAMGAGKSTLLGCVGQLLQPSAGRICFLGNDLASLGPGRLRRTIGFAGMALPLLKGGLVMNLRYRDPKASLDKIARLLSRCGLEPFVARLPNGLDTRISDDGSNLSQGERQAVLLTRALLGSPPILIVDSVDSHLDQLVVERLAGTFRQYSGIVLMAVSRPELVATATRVWRLEDGALTETENRPSAGVVDLSRARAPGDQKRTNV